MSGSDLTGSAVVAERTGRDRSYGEVLSALKAAQKPSKGAPAYSRFVNRKLGRLIAAGAYLAGLTPNMVTAISATFSLAGILLIALVHPNAVIGILVALALVLGYAFDAADGQLARLRGGGTKSGEWLDHMVDSAKISSLHLAVLIGAYRFYDLGHAGWLLVPIFFTLISNVMFFGMILNDQLRRVSAATSGTALDAGTPNNLRALLVLPTDYGVLCVVFALLGATDVFFGVYTFLCAASAGFLLLASVKWFRDMGRLN